ncbi:MAG: endonuclease III [candidate division Zixibacteria bacterium]|nr:endonuclease III [candidate division Zixibacteria bacterium]
MTHLINKIDKLLAENYGDKQLIKHRDPVGELVNTILSQNTSDVNRDKAFNRLKERFPEWEQVAEAHTNSIKAMIKPGGLSAVKAPRIKKILNEIRNGNGRIDLSNLYEMKPDEGLKYLTSFNGVGFKTAACVLLFACGKEVFPVDTHIYRTSKRIGLVDDKADREKAFETMNSLVPGGIAYRLHLNMIQLGRKICRPKRPLCGECPLNKMCKSAFKI